MNNPMFCQRCQDPLPAYITSFFNRDVICIDCSIDEKLAPGYGAAHDAERAQVQAGNYNFVGVGLSAADAQYLLALRVERGPKDTQSYSDGTHPIAIVRAEAHSDDRLYETSFDALPWLSQATPGDIAALAACGWGGDCPADAVAQWSQDVDAARVSRASDATTLSHLFHYLSQRRWMDRDRVGFECHVNEADARVWLSVHRPSVLVGNTTA